MSNYIKRMFKVQFNENAEEFEMLLYKNCKFLTNDNNVLYFEYTYDESDGKCPSLAKYLFKIIPYNDTDNIPLEYEYLCSFEDNAHIRYFVYSFSPESNIFGKFMNMFGGF